jgi:type IV pilus assembly protein PilA
MKRLEQGFTLIELMIVVAIIGILAAVAIPSYKDYTARAQVTEAVSLTSQYKTSLAEYFSSNGAWPSFTDMGGTTAGKYVGSLTFSGASGSTIVVQATMRGAAPAAADVQSKIFAIGTSDGGETWSCGTQTGPQSSTTNLDKRFLPASCR